MRQSIIGWSLKRDKLIERLTGDVGKAASLWDAVDDEIAREADDGDSDDVDTEPDQADGTHPDGTDGDEEGDGETGGLWDAVDQEIERQREADTPPPF